MMQRPLVGAAQHVPGDRELGLEVAAPVVGEPGRQGLLVLAIVLARCGIGPEEVTEQQGELFGEAARPPNVDMGAALAWRLPEVPLGALGVGGPIQEPGRLQGRPERLDRFQPLHRDLVAG